MLLLNSFFRLKELFREKNGLTRSLLIFFLKMPKIWVGQMTLNGEKKTMALQSNSVMDKSVCINGVSILSGSCYLSQKTPFFEQY